MRARFVRVRVQKFASGYEAMAEESGIAVNGFSTETAAVRGLATALAFKSGRFDVHAHGKADDGVADLWSISETV